MEIGQPVIDRNGKPGTVRSFGPAGPDGDRLVTIDLESGNVCYAWWTEFQATDLHTPEGLVWQIF